MSRNNWLKFNNKPNHSIPGTYMKIEQQYCFFIQVFGNLLSWSILYSGASSANANETTSPDLTVCGIKDCQDPNITEQNISQYEPASDITLYATIGSLGLLCFLSTVISLIFIPPLNTANEKMPDKPKYSQGKTSSSTKELTDHGALEDKTLQTKHQVSLLWEWCFELLIHLKLSLLNHRVCLFSIVINQKYFLFV